ncbi:MAG: hypothetical protein LBF80_04770 [Spirochaetaceae bacterium]|jgi:hypothetical protein|nr:hypothetical protein [Spirochaetaceae bacterium]
MDESQNKGKPEEKLALVSSDKEALHAYQMREMALSDWTSGVNFARAGTERSGIEDARERTAFQDLLGTQRA